MCRTTDKCSVKLIRKLEDYLEQYSCDEQSLARTYPPTLFNKLKNSCIERRKDEDWNYNDKLVGALNQQSSLVPIEGLEDYLVHTSQNIWHTFFQTCPYSGVFDPKYLELRELWVNYQKPGQYNPYHCHHGGKFCYFCRHTIRCGRTERLC